MCDKKWFAVNLKAAAVLARKEDLLFTLYKEIIFEFKETVDSWHFLWESEPFPHTLLLRFYGKSDVVDNLKEALYKLLDEKGVEYAPDGTYDGEVGSYGTTGWEYVMKILHVGSSYALDLIKKVRQQEANGKFRKPISIYIDRWLHLFLNQLTTRVSEYKTLFSSSVHRYAINRIGVANYNRVSGELAKEVPTLLNEMTDRVDAFLRSKGIPFPASID